MTLPCLLGLAALLPLIQPPVDRPARWEKEIAAIEKRLTDQPPPKGGVAFVGSRASASGTSRSHSPTATS